VQSAALYVEVNAACIAILMAVLFKLRKGIGDHRSATMFGWVLCVSSIFFGIDAIWGLVEYGALQLSPLANRWLNALYFSFSGLTGYVWFIYAEAAQNPGKPFNRLKIAIYTIPMTALTVLSVLSITNGWIFWIDEMNHYHRGPLYPLQPVIAYCYPMDTAIRAIVRGSRTRDYNVRVRSYALSSFALPPLACMVVQAVLPPGMPLLCVGMTIALLHVFLSFQEQMISQDQLTELYNRHQLMRHLSTRLALETRGKNLYLLMIDVDHFKSINDEYGHLEGDSALVLVAKALRMACTEKNDFLCRYGGDEFIVVHEADNDREVEALCDRIRLAAAQISAGKPYELRLSIGFAQHGPNAVIARELISSADNELYRRRRSGGHHVA